MGRELCVIFNPTAARGRAGRGLADLRRHLQDQAEFWPTEHAGHAEELARQAARSGFPVVAAAGGDGTVHEVANGVLTTERPDVRLAVFPLGSANDYAYSLKKAGPDGGVWSVDVGRVRGDNGRQRYFINTLGLGFSGAVTIEARRIHYLRGLPLYALGLLRALWRRYAVPQTLVTLDSLSHRGPTLSLTVAIAHREGGFVIAPRAELDDGLFDYLLVGDLSRWQVLRFLPTLAIGAALPADDPRIRQGRCSSVAVTSAGALTVHLDGEFFCQAEDGVFNVAVDILPRRLQVQTFP